MEVGEETTISLALFLLARRFIRGKTSLHTVGGQVHSRQKEHHSHPALLIRTSDMARVVSSSSGLQKDLVSMVQTNDGSVFHV